jgi:hypothetical protein
MESFNQFLRQWGMSGPNDVDRWSFRGVPSNWTGMDIRPVRRGLSRWRSHCEFSCSIHVVTGSRETPGTLGGTYRRGRASPSRADLRLLMSHRSDCRFSTIPMRNLHVYLRNQRRFSIIVNFTSHVTGKDSINHACHISFGHMSGWCSNPFFRVLVSFRDLLSRILLERRPRSSRDESSRD